MAARELDEAEEERQVEARFRLLSLRLAHGSGCVRASSARDTTSHLSFHHLHRPGLTAGMHLGRGPAFGIVCAGKWAVSGEISQIDLHFVTGRATGKHIRHRYPFLTSNWFPSLAWGGVGWGGGRGWVGNVNKAALRSHRDQTT